MSSPRLRTRVIASAILASAVIGIAIPMGANAAKPEPGSKANGKWSTTTTTIASGIGGMDMQLAAHTHYLASGIERFSPFWTPGSWLNVIVRLLWSALRSFTTQTVVLRWRFSISLPA